MNAYLYVLNTLADWEIAYLTAEIHSRRFFSKESPDCRLLTVGNSRDAVVTMGGMTITPDLTIDEIVDGPGDILILPGGDTWLTSENDKVLQLAERRNREDKLVAAICGATLGLAKVGVLDGKRHTSNDKEFLKFFVKEYRGEELYETLPSVNDRNLITASGQSPIDFTYEILKALKLLRPSSLEAWRNLYRTNEPRYFFELMKSLES